jgi:hypothetical protein
MAMRTLPNTPSPDQGAATAAGPRSALIIAHPGHELRVHAWLEAARPVVCVLTDGSGSAGASRLASTTDLLARTAARRGAVYGPLSDRAIYGAILDRDFRRFTALADELIDMLVHFEIDTVVADAAEGYNPTHDVCRLLVNGAVRAASRRRGDAIACYEFAVVGAPNDCPDGQRVGAVELRLDEAALSRKLAAARGYRELTAEVERALREFGQEPFRTEWLRPVDPTDRYGWHGAEPPCYERYGEQRVADGVYDRVLRYRDHIAPLADALWDHTEKRG